MEYRAAASPEHAWGEWYSEQMGLEWPQLEA
jgi:hypothetical protein